jgi:hypothetical protein
MMLRHGGARKRERGAGRRQQESLHAKPHTEPTDEDVPPSESNALPEPWLNVSVTY